MKQEIKTIILESQERNFTSIKKRELDIPLDIPMIISLIGPRRSGKTYLLYDVYQRLVSKGIERQNIVYINFEDERLDLNVSELDLILQSYLELYPNANLEECYFFFDEIQNIEGWEKFVRRMFDTVSKKIFITGSNAKLLSTEIATSLRGRTITYTVLPLSLKEYLSFKNIEISFFNTQKKAKLLSHISEFIMNGGFPEVIDFDSETRLRVLQSYFNTMIYRDIIERYRISDALTLKFFIKKIFASVGKPLSINKIYNDIKSQGYKISNNTLYDYEDYCRTIFLTVAIPKFDFSEIKQAKSEKKTYSIDSGLLNAIEFSFSQNIGKQFENVVLLEFLKAEKEVFYYKDIYECDFILKEQNTFKAIQVTYHMEKDETRERELKSLAVTCQKLGLTEGTIITFDQKEEFIYKEILIKVLPFYEMFLK